MIDYITPIKAQLDENMHKVCVLFMTIGTPEETPRYFNYKGFNNKTKVLKIGSTQRNIFFEVQTEIDFFDLDTMDFWNQFKEYRTNFLLTNYPTINPY